jgi:glycosyltransferase involved in cell wall biosynthesis
VRVSVVVTTYNAPRELDLVLCGLARQTRPPDEILVADDGSTEETARRIAGWKTELPALIHVRHEDRGYRKSRSVNLAVRRSTGDHLLFLDGDAIPHSRWAEDHVRAADERRILCGRRVKLGPAISKQIDNDAVRAGRLEALFGPVLRSVFSGGTSRFLLGVRLPPLLARLCHPRARKLMGVNFSLPRGAFEAVNGYDEQWDVPWREDRDLELRLRRAGYPFFPLLNRAVVYHLWHETKPFPPESQAVNTEIEGRAIVRCAQGLSEHEGVAPDPP